jgi:hypothetical protein
MSFEFKPSYVNNRGDKRRKAGEEEQWNIRTSLSSIGKEQRTSLSVKKQGREASSRAWSLASAQGGGLRRPRRELRRPRREGVSGVRAGGVRTGRGVSGVRRRSKQGVSRLRRPQAGGKPIASSLCLLRRSLIPSRARSSPIARTFPRAFPAHARAARLGLASTTAWPLGDVESAWNQRQAPPRRSDRLGGRLHPYSRWKAKD